MPMHSIEYNILLWGGMLVETNTNPILSAAFQKKMNKGLKNL